MEIRNSLDYTSWRERKALAAAIRPIYTVPTAEAAQAELHSFEAGSWGTNFRPWWQPGVGLGAR